MGNAPSHASSGGPSTASTAGATPSAPSATATAPVPTSTPGTSTPSAIPTSSRTSRPSVSSVAPAFHSGLTPPPRPPSPPPPSTPPLLPHGGHLSAQNPHALSHPQVHDYSKSIVTRLIIDGMLAPFYRGLEDFEEGWVEEDIRRVLTEVREKDYEEGVGNSVVEAMKAEREGGGGGVGQNVAKRMGMHKEKERRKEEEKEERERREVKAYLDATECPICFLSYPPNINTSRCCQQPICTECFVQIKRSEATITHLESESACCPYCVETDFGVIYERPIDPLKSTISTQSNSALAISPEGQSGFSQALSLGEEDADLSVGVGMAPKQQETVRRKSVGAKDKQVVTIDQIRPDWEDKLNAVKAAAARKASRRIVMRQVGDRLIPIGYTSARAPGTADFSMSVGQTPEAAPGDSGSRRDRRRGSGRERDLEELMIMEAMRLSLLDHEEHQRRNVEPARNSTDQQPGPGGSSSNLSPPATGRLSLSGSSTPNRRGSATLEAHTPNKSPSAASKLLSKFGGNRSRSGSAASGRNVTFAPSQMGPSGGMASSSSIGLAGSGSGGRSASGSISTPSPPIPPTATTPATSTSVPTSQPPSPVVAKAIPQPPPQQQQQAQRTTTPPASLSPSISIPVAPITTLTDATASSSPTTTTTSAPKPPIAEGMGAGPAGLPRISLDMPPLAPDHARTAPSGETVSAGPRKPAFNREETGLSTVESVGGEYAQLDSDGE